MSGTSIIAQISMPLNKIIAHSVLTDSTFSSEHIYYSSTMFILFTCSIQVINMYFQEEWKTVWIIIRWLHFQERINRSSAGQWLIQ